MILTIYLLGVVISGGILFGSRDYWYEEDQPWHNVLFVFITLILSWFFVGWFVGDSKT